EAGGQTTDITGNVKETYKNDQQTTISGSLTITAKTISITSEDGVSISAPTWKDNCHGYKWTAIGANLALTGLSVKHTMFDVSHNPLS
ncbi:hypothetical protein, partial [Clostridium perfringens]